MKIECIYSFVNILIKFDRSQIFLQVLALRTRFKYKFLHDFLFKIEFKEDGRLIQVSFGIQLKIIDQNKL